MNDSGGQAKLWGGSAVQISFLPNQISQAYIRIYDAKMNSEIWCSLRLPWGTPSLQKSLHQDAKGGSFHVCFISAQMLEN